VLINLRFANETHIQMITGFNHNLKYKGGVFHVQTEDSGVKTPHVITHLFIGGNIVATKKVNYQNIVGKENMEKIVKDLMEQQHKDMINRLLRGDYDAHPLVIKVINPSVPAPLVQKPEAKPPEKPRETGSGLVSGKSLDEIILDYLTDEVEEK
jgi:hypothetical protein